MLQEADFEGVWALSRQIIDHRLGQVGRFEGSASILAQPEGHWHYTEVGEVQMGTGPVLRAERSYL